MININYVIFAENWETIVNNKRIFTRKDHDHETYLLNSVRTLYPLVRDKHVNLVIWICDLTENHNPRDALIERLRKKIEFQHAEIIAIVYKLTKSFIPTKTFGDYVPSAPNALHEAVYLYILQNGRRGANVIVDNHVLFNELDVFDKVFTEMRNKQSIMASFWEAGMQTCFGTTIRRNRQRIHTIILFFIAEKISEIPRIFLNPFSHKQQMDLLNDDTIVKYYEYQRDSLCMLSEYFMNIYPSVDGCLDLFLFLGNACEASNLAILSNELAHIKYGRGDFSQEIKSYCIHYPWLAKYSSLFAKQMVK